MKKLVLFVLLFSIGIFAQDWGGKIRLGQKFMRSDSLRLFEEMGDSLYANAKDSLFSDALMMSEIDGIYNVSMYLEGISGTSSSIKLQVRLGKNFGSGVVKWTPWIDIFTSAKKDTLYNLSISSADSSWWTPANLRQYLLIETDADTVRPYLTDYVK